MKKFRDLFWIFKGVTVFSLVGESGTGKSFHAKLLAQKYGIDLIIDDGLLIENDKILAGHSAKREKTFMAAVKVALFDDKEHRDEIAKVLEKTKFKKILILGTSEKMVFKIASRLQIPQPSTIFHIEDIATKEEIEKAIHSRTVEGKHVIPVPSIEIQRNYPKIFYDKIRVMVKRKNKKNLSANTKVFEKTVVRPEFSKKGRIEISEAAISEMVMHCVRVFDENIRIRKLKIKSDFESYRIIITIDVPFGTQLSGKIHNLQQYIIDNIERDTNILINEVSIIIDKISRPTNLQNKGGK